MLFATTILAAICFSSAFAAPGFRNSEKLRVSPNGKAKANSYIVVLKKGASRDASLQALDELVVASSERKKVTRSEWSVINGYCATLSGSALQHVLDDPNVDYVEENAIFTINWQQGVRREVELRPAGALGLRAASGSGVDVYAIDTGVRVTHQSFGGRARWGASFNGAQVDGNGHGTHTAATIAGAKFGPATQADVIAVKVLDDAGSGTNADIIDGVNFVTKAAQESGKPSVANMSLGGSVFKSLDMAVDASIKSGVHYVVAAGNENMDAKLFSPAHVPNAITVGAISRDNTKAEFSNFGRAVDIWYLGVDVTSAWIGSDTDENTISGTSMASPGVAGLVAVHLSSNPAATIPGVAKALVGAAVSDVRGAPSSTTKLRAVPF